MGFGMRAKKEQTGKIYGTCVLAEVRRFGTTVMTDFDSEMKFERLLEGKFNEAKEAIGISAVQKYTFNFSEDESKKIGKSWHNLINKMKAKGKRIIKLQACKIPLTSDINEMIIWILDSFRKDPSSVEEWLFVRMDDYIDIAGDWNPLHEYWLFDEKSAILVEFSEEGRILLEKEITDHKLLNQMVKIKKGLMKRGVKLEEFAKKYSY